jgi:hypothetical protein
LEDRDQEDSSSRPAWASTSQDLSQKYRTQKTAGGVAQVIEILSSKCKALSSNPSTAKKKKKKSKVGLKDQVKC